MCLYLVYQTLYIVALIWIKVGMPSSNKTLISDTYVQVLCSQNYISVENKQHLLRTENRKDTWSIKIGLRAQNMLTTLLGATFNMIVGEGGGTPI